MDGRKSRSYVVVLRGSSAIRLPHGEGARFLLGPEDGQAEVRVRTEWVDSGFDHPIPRELLIEVRIEAGSIDQAIDQARGLSNVVIPIIAFSTNATISRVEPHIAFETTPCLTERDFAEYFVPDERGLLPQSREGDPATITATAGAFFASEDKRWLSVALAHYFVALGYYQVGGEALAVGHLFMAAEALREVALARYCTVGGRSESDIMADEGHKTRGDLLAWARSEIVFAGDKAVHRAAKLASDGLEHGFKSVADVRALAEPICDETFRYVRAAVVDLLDVTAVVRKDLLDRFGLPADTQSLRRRVTGVLVGDTDDLASPGRAYPILEWTSSITHFDLAEGGEPEVRFNDRFTVRTADSIGFQVRSMEFYGRVRDGTGPQQLEAEIQTADEAAARDRVMPLIRRTARALAACGPGEEGADFPQPLGHLLELFNRVKGLFRACVVLLEQGLPEESLIVGRALIRDALRLEEAADGDEATRNALAFGWRCDSLNASADLFDELEASEATDRRKRVDEQRSRILEAARRFGVKDPLSFSPTAGRLSSQPDDDYRWIDGLAAAVEDGWDIATRSRARAQSKGIVGFHDTAPDSWVYPLAAKFVGGGCLIAANAALRLFGWSDPSNQVAEAGVALEEFEAALNESGDGEGEE